MIDEADDVEDTQAVPNVRASQSAAPVSSLSLLIMSPTGTGSVPIPKNGTLVLGRAQECDVKIDDAKLSRRHAELRCGATVEIVDLGSRNGSFVRDERVPPNVPFPVRVGDSIGIGSTVLILQRAMPGGDRPRHLWSHGYFEARLEEECGRASRAGEPFAILRLRLEPNAGANAATQKMDTSAGTILAWLGEADMLGSYAPNDYEVLLISSPAEVAEARAADLAKRLTAAHAKFDVAVAAFPRDGRTPEALIEHANRTLRRRTAPGVDATSTRAVLAIGALERMDRVVRRVAEGTINVLILGETGVGKEILARRIHELSPRARMPLVSLNCAALSETLLESELFGHEKGSFTGAVQAKPGLLESANGGLVFLDEIGEMPLSTQAKLLRVIEQREVTRVGALRPRAIDVRFLAATNRNLETEIEAGRFRQDLYFRMNGISLSLPPLRERIDEIEPLTRAFIDHACRAMARTDRPQIAADAMETLKHYEWPGNIRELRNVVERAVLLCSTGVITREHLPLEKLGPILAVRTSVAPPRMTIPAARPLEGETAPMRVTDFGQEATTSGGEPPPWPDDEARRKIVDALEKCAGNQSQAAKLLGISRATLIRRIEDFAIPRPRKRE